MDKLKEWADRVNEMADPHPEKTFGNKPFHENYVSIEFLKDQLKKLASAREEAEAVLAQIKEVEKKISVLLSKYRVTSGRIF